MGAVELNRRISRAQLESREALTLQHQHPDERTRQLRIPALSKETPLRSFDRRQLPFLEIRFPKVDRFPSRRNGRLVDVLARFRDFSFEHPLEDHGDLTENEGPVGESNDVESKVLRVFDTSWRKW